MSKMSRSNSGSFVSIYGCILSTATVDRGAEGLINCNVRDCWKNPCKWENLMIKVIISHVNQYIERISIIMHVRMSVRYIIKECMFVYSYKPKKNLPRIIACDTCCDVTHNKRNVF